MPNPVLSISNTKMILASDCTHAQALVKVERHIVDYSKIRIPS